MTTLTNENQVDFKPLEDGTYLLSSQLDFDNEYSMVMKKPTFKESFGDMIMLHHHPNYKPLPNNAPRPVFQAERRIMAFDSKGNQYRVFRHDARLKTGTLKRMTKKEAEQLKMDNENRN